MGNDLLHRFLLPSTAGAFALALLGAACLLFFAGAVADLWGAFDLATFRVFTLLLLVMLVAGLVQAGQRVREEGMVPLLARLATLAVLLSGLAVYLFRFEGTMILAEGEAYEPLVEAYSNITKGPLARVPAPVFVLAAIAAGGQPSGFTVISGAGGRTADSAAGELELDGSRIRLIRRGVMPLVELLAANGGVVAREYVRIDVDGPAGQDSFMFVNNPYEFIVRRQAVKTGHDGVVLQVAARRGKLKIAQGTVDVRTPLKMAGLTLTMPEIKRSGIFQVSRHPGYTLFLVACAACVALHGLSAVYFLRRRAGRSEEN